MIQEQCDMNKYIMLLSCMLVCVSFGCSTSGRYEPNPEPTPIEQTTAYEVAEKYFSVYINSTNISHITLSSMFRYYLYSAHDNSWGGVNESLNLYINQATNQYIDINYPIKATYNEGIFLQNAAQDAIKYCKSLDMGPTNYKTHFTDIAILLIKRMYEYEYDRTR